MSEPEHWDDATFREGDLRALLGVSQVIDAILGVIAKVFGWCFLLMVLVICFDVVTRKFGFQLWIGDISLGSTRLQELEWHLHAFLFLTWIGYCYTQNAHVRIDVFTSGLSQRAQSWLEVIGCLVFALPYVWVALPYAWDFFRDSFRQLESSAAPNGLPARYIVKFFLFYGFLSVFASIVSVLCRRIAFLFGSPEVARMALPEPPAATH